MSGSPGGDGAPLPEAGAATFDADLRLLRRRVVRRWALAVAARCAIAALAVAVVAALPAACGLIGWAWTIGVPAALVVLALGARLSRPPSLAQVARLLDDRLGLFDVTATALQVERAGEPVDEGPAAPVYAEAAALLRAGASAWRPRARLGSRELVAAGALVAVLVAIVLVGTSGGAGAGAGKVTATSLPPGLRHRAPAGPNSVSPPLVPPRAKRKGARRAADGARRHPYGLYAYGFEGEHQRPRFSSKAKEGVHYSGGRRPGSQPQDQFAAPGAAEGNEAREKAEEEAAQAAARPGANGERERGAEPPPGQSLKALTGGATPPSGSVSPVPSGSSGGRPSSSDRSASAPSSSAAPGARSAAAPGHQGGGRPSGSETAGTERASLASGEKGREGGQTGGELALKAGFAAVRSGKAASGRGPRNAQGAGGPGRSAGIGGAAFEEADAGSLGYVPPDAGVAPTLDPGLFARYLDALAAIAGRRW